MGLILNLETSTKVCSVALALDGQVLVQRDLCEEGYSHAENLNLFIQEVMEESGYNLNDLDAVAVSEGPGSYTGLRIGTSTAKGICYALKKPLIAVNSLKALASLANVNQGYIVPMFDARRMEVYMAVFDQGLELIRPTEAHIVEKDSLTFLSGKHVICVGPGAEKCRDIINDNLVTFDTETQVSAAGMVLLSEDKLQRGEFVDTAYFEPFYLKNFVAGPPKKVL